MLLLTFALIAAAAFICEYVDSSLGMGYGTTLAPMLMLAGFQPLVIVPAILLSEFLTGLGAAMFHHKLKNVNLRRGTQHFKTAMMLSICSVIGVIAAVFVALNIPSLVLKGYIGLLVLSMGLIMLVNAKKIFRFSYKKIVFLGGVAAFNKGMSGGGYGPVTTGGQILAGVESKAAIGITSLAEGITCLVGILLYFVLGQTVDWSLAPALVTGAMISVPLAAYSVKKIGGINLKLVIGVVTLLLGAMTLANLLLA
jgi:hypothetical protein